MWCLVCSGQEVICVPYMPYTTVHERRQVDMADTYSVAYVTFYQQCGREGWR